MTEPRFRVIEEPAASGGPAWAVVEDGRGGPTVLATCSAEVYARVIVTALTVQATLLRRGQVFVAAARSAWLN